MTTKELPQFSYFSIFHIYKQLGRVCVYDCKPADTNPGTKFSVSADESLVRARGQGREEQEGHSTA